MPMQDGSGECKHFRLTMSFKDGEPLSVDVYSVGVENRHGALTKTCPVKGPERGEYYKEDLRTKKTSKFQKEQIRKLDPLVASENNLADS